MSQEEILEYNKKCAAFLGWDYNKFMDRWNEEDFQHEYYNTNSIDLKFHSDWNWIMEVVEAIQKIIIQNNNEFCIEFYEGLPNERKTFVSINNIKTESIHPKEAVVKAINKFLIKYNNEHKNKRSSKPKNK